MDMPVFLAAAYCKNVPYYGNPWLGIAPTWAAVMGEVFVQS
jgi:4-hydroxybenzoate polyprenyltransferase